MNFDEKLKLINKLVWYVPFRGIRDAIRNYLLYLIDTEENINSKVDNIINFYNINKLSQEINKKAFLKFKNIHEGKDIVLISSDKSIEKFLPIENAIYVGIYDSIFNKNISLDYYFISKGQYIHNSSFNKNCIKFHGIYNNNMSNLNNIILDENSICYVADDSILSKNFVYDISNFPIPNYKSILFTAIQFIFWTNPSNIYIAGVDYTDNLNFEKEDNIISFRNNINLWVTLNTFRNIFYPKTKITVLNPLGLNTIFDEMYNINNNYKSNLSIDDYKICFNNIEYSNAFLDNNRYERMDANIDSIFPKSRREFHIDRYLFASKYVKDKVVIDSASGTGYGANILYNTGKAKKVYGVEINKKAVAYAQNKYGNENIIYKQGSILELPFDNEQFDVFTSFETIEHIENDEKQILEVKRVLKKGGHYILSTPNSWGLHKYHVKDYDYFSIKELISKYFKIEKIYNQNSDKPTTNQKTDYRNYRK